MVEEEKPLLYQLCEEGDLGSFVNLFNPLHPDQESLQILSKFTQNDLQGLLDKHAVQVARGHEPELIILLRTLNQLKKHSSKVLVDTTTVLLESIPWGYYGRILSTAYSPYSRFEELYKKFSKLAQAVYSESSPRIALEATLKWAIDRNLGLVQGIASIRPLYKGRLHLYGIVDELPPELDNQISTHYSYNPHNLVVPFAQWQATRDEVNLYRFKH